MNGGFTTITWLRVENHCLGCISQSPHRLEYSTTQCMLPFQLPQCFWRRWRPDHCETDFATRLYIIVTFYRRMCARRYIKRQSDQRDVTPVAFLTQIPNSRAPQNPVAVDFTASNGDISVNNRSTTDQEKPIPVDCKFTRHGIASQCFSLRIKSSARWADVKPRFH